MSNLHIMADKTRIGVIMTDITQAFFGRLAERGNEPLLHNISGTIRWVVQGVGSWLVVVKNGSLAVSNSADRADCVCTCGKDDFERMVVGVQNSFTAYLQQKIKVTGNLGLLQMFQRLFPDEALAETKRVG
jgi:hypothetical protein